MQNTSLFFSCVKRIGYGALLLAFVSAEFYPIRAVAADKDCGELVDMADSGDFESLQKCEASERGLNKAFQRLFRSAEGENEESAVTPVQQAAAHFSSVGSLAEVRFQLLKRAAKTCGGSFVVDKEKYDFDASGGVLSLMYTCDSSSQAPAVE